MSIVKVKQGQALVRSNVFSGEVQVSFTGGFVWPVANKAEIMDISIKTVNIDRTGSDGVICRDDIRADIKIAFFLRVNNTENDIIKVAQMLGCDRASDPKVLREMFIAKFSAAMDTAAKQFDFADLHNQREEYRERLLEILGPDLNGYSLEDCSIDYLEQTHPGRVGRKTHHRSASPYESQIGFSRAVRLGNRIVVSGTAPIGADGATIDGDAYAQARRCFEIIAEAIEALGGNASDVLRTRMYLTAAEDWEAVGRAHGECFHGTDPAATMVVVKELLDPHWRVEIEAEAEVTPASS